MFFQKRKFSRRFGWCLACPDRKNRPICAILALFALWRQMGVPPYFCSLIRKSKRFYISKMKWLIPRKLWPFESLDALVVFFAKVDFVSLIANLIKLFHNRFFWVAGIPCQAIGRKFRRFPFFDKTTIV